MTIEAASGWFDSPTSTGVATAVSGLSFQPKCIILQTVAHTAQDARPSDTLYSFGVAIGTGASDEYCVGGSSDNGAANAITYNVDDDVVLHVPSIAGATFLQANLDAFNSDGFDLNWTTVDGSARKVQWLALGGSSLNVGLTNATIPTSGTFSETGLSFTPDGVLTFGSFQDTSASLGTINSNFTVSIGAWDGTNEAYVARRDNDGAATGQAYRTQSNSYLAGNIGIVNVSAPINGTSLASGGWTFTPSSYPVVTKRIFVLSLGGLNLEVGESTFPASPTTSLEVNFTGAFQPKAVMTGFVGITTGSDDTAGDDGRYSVGWFTGTTAANNGSCGMDAEEGAANMNVNCWNYDDAVVMAANVQSGAIYNSASVASLDTDGFTLDLDTTDAGARHFWWLALGPASSAPDTTTGIEFFGTEAGRRASGLTGAADSSVFTFSCWAKFGTGTGQMSVIEGEASSSQRFWFYKNLFTNVAFFGVKGNSGETLASGFGQTALNDDEWHHHLVIWDGTTSPGELTYFLDGQNDLDSGSSEVRNGTADFGGIDEWHIGENFSNTSRMDGCIGELWLHTGVALTPGTAYAKFVTGGNAKDLGSDGSTPDSQPDIYLSGGASQFFDNFGSGGAFYDAAIGVSPWPVDCAIGSLVATITAIASLSAAIQEQKTIAASLGAAIQVEGTASSTLGAAISATLDAAASLDAAISLEGTASSSLGAVIQSARSATASLQSAILEARTAAASLGAYIEAPGERSATASLQAAILEVQSATAALDAAIAVARTAAVSLDAVVSVPSTATAALGAAVLEAKSASASLQAAISISGSASAALDAVVALPGLATLSVDAVVLAGMSASASLSAYISTLTGPFNPSTTRRHSPSARGRTHTPPARDRRH